MSGPFLCFFFLCCRPLAKAPAARVALAAGERRLGWAGRGQKWREGSRADLMAVESGGGDLGSGGAGVNSGDGGGRNRNRQPLTKNMMGSGGLWG